MRVVNTVFLLVGGALLTSLVACSDNEPPVSLKILGSCKQTCEHSLFAPIKVNDKVMKIRLGAVRCIFIYDYYFQDKDLKRGNALTPKEKAQRSQNYLRWERESHCQKNIVKYLTKKPVVVMSVCHRICNKA